MKVDVDEDVIRCHYRIFNMRNIRETIDSFARGPYISFFLTDICSLCWQKCGPGPKLFPRQDIFSTFSGVHTLNFIGPHEEPSNFYGEKRSVAFVTSHLFTFLMVFISRLFGDYANIDMWKSDYMKAWNSITNDCDRFDKNQTQRPLR